MAVNTYRSTNNIQPLPLLEPHIWTLATLPFHHRDPFDRILIAQAITEDWTLVTVDSIFCPLSSQDSKLIAPENSPFLVTIQP
jgi:PIN domain nuclease of toxin-antitoxin system